MTFDLTGLPVDAVQPVQDSSAHQELSPIAKVAAPWCPPVHIASLTPRSPQLPLRPLCAFLVLSTCLLQVNETP